MHTHTHVHTQEPDVLCNSSRVVKKDTVDPATAHTHTLTHIKVHCHACCWVFHADWKRLTGDQHQFTLQRVEWGWGCVFREQRQNWKKRETDSCCQWMLIWVYYNSFIMFSGYTQKTHCCNYSVCTSESFLCELVKKKRINYKGNMNDLITQYTHGSYKVLQRIWEIKREHIFWHAGLLHVGSMYDVHSQRRHTTPCLFVL